MLGKPSESELSITFINGSKLTVMGLDRPERIEGSPVDGLVLDEYANMKPEAWESNIRPALADRNGWCWLVGVPEGRNHYYQKYLNALVDDTGEWAVYTWKSADILSPLEIAAAKKDMDERTFRQEYEASFEAFNGVAYYKFDQEEHCAPLTYDPEDTIGFCFDFNVAPGVACIVQEQRLPNLEWGTGVIGEVWIPENSKTNYVCHKLIEEWGDHKGEVHLYGDATGGSRGTAKVAGSDWDIIREELRPVFGDRLKFKVKRSNPPERTRVNSVNSRLKTVDGTVRMMIDKRFSQHVVKDLEGVMTLEGGSGEIDKKGSKELSHISDALGYYVTYEFPITEKIKSENIILPGMENFSSVNLNIQQNYGLF
jgi:hypothetical protein